MSLSENAAQRLAADFSGRASLATAGVGALYDALTGRRRPRVEVAFDEWKTTFSQIGGPNLESRRGKLERLATAFHIDDSDWRPAELLFALHTYYALIVKSVARRACDNLGGGNFVLRLSNDPFEWVESAQSSAIGELVQDIALRLNQYDFASLRTQPWQGGDLFQPLYERLFPKQVRHALGEFYTPDWLADRVLDGLDCDGHPDRRLLDPACGSGIFLLAAIGRVRAWYARHSKECGLGEDELCRKILANLVGCDLNPLAVLAARTNYLLALGDLLGVPAQIDLPVYQCDSILSPPPLGRFDYVAGNPPWVAWDNLPADYREATKPLWERYGLFSLGGTAARHGGGKKDLSMLMLYRAADRHLTDGGRLGFVMTQTLLQTGGAGDGFRRFRLGQDGAWLGVTRVDDLVAARPFAGASNWTCVLFLNKGRPTSYPVPYVQWHDRFRHEQRQARPIDPARSNSPWLIEEVPPAAVAEAASFGHSQHGIRQAGSLPHEVGPSDYAAHLGANSGGANGVYWVRILEQTPQGVLIENIAEKSKKPIERVRQVIELDLLYPLARWSDISRYRVAPSCYLLLAQDPVTRTGLDEARMRREYPLTYAYLAQFESLLRARAAYRRYQGQAAFYSMYDVGQYTLAPHKVIWRRMDKQMSAAVARDVVDPILGRRPLVPQETCVLVATRSAAEAHYLCAMLNSAVVNEVVQSHSVRGGKSFGTPGMLAYLNLRCYDPLDSRHKALAGLCRRAHRAAAAGNDVSALQSAIDLAAAECLSSGIRENSDGPGVQP